MGPRQQGVFGLGTSKTEKVDKAREDGGGRKTPSWRGLLFKPHRLRSIAKYCPLVAAILAPLSTLLDIPALTQHWYSKFGDPQPDPKVSLGLSALGLALNVLANVLLIMRFTSREPIWIRQSTRLSLLFWIGKTVVALVNLIVFGILTRNGNGYSYSEGFWCAVVSVIDAGVISIALLFHYFFAFGRETEDTNEVRSEGRKFMLSVTLFLIIMAFQSLAFCKIEHWAYSDAIYFSVQTALTIGYGDFDPTTTAGKVLVFPFSVLTISQLGNEIALIVAFISSRADERRARWRQRYEVAMHREANILHPSASLLEEMALIHQINAREEMMSQLYDLLWSALSLIVFWMIGAVTFSEIEGWTFGNAVYAVMILSLTIGFGDFTPITPAGKVVFVVYALAAVPIVTSFAVQSITGLLSTYQQRGGDRERFKRERTKDPEVFMPHADFIQRAHESFADIRKRLVGEDAKDAKNAPKNDEHALSRASDGDASEATAIHDGETAGDKDSHPSRGEAGEPSRQKIPEASRESGPQPSEEDAPSRCAHQAEEREDANDQEEVKESDKGIQEDVELVAGQLHEGEPSSDEADKREANDKTEEHKIEVDLLKQLMDRIIRLEAEARQMLLDSMEKGFARTVLLADRNVQVRDVRALRGDDANMLAIWRGEEEKTAHDQKDREEARQDEDVDMLNRVRRYRNTFAEILVIGSILQKLEGEELNRFERWRDNERDAEVTEEHREGEGLEDVAGQTWDGITGRVMRRHAKRLTEKDWKDMERGLAKLEGAAHHGEAQRRGSTRSSGH